MCEGEEEGRDQFHVCALKVSKLIIDQYLCVVRGGGGVERGKIIL